MVLEEYMTNPMGKGSSMMMVYEIRKSLDTQYREIQSKIRIRWYLIKNKKLVALIKLPSRSLEKVSYDVIFEFDLDSIPAGSNSINRALFRVFSNCPSFTYTFAYVFNERQLLCDWAADKYSPQVLTHKPVVRNSYELISYERSIYLAAKYILSNGRNNVRINKTLAVIIDGYAPVLFEIRTEKEIKDLYSSEKTKQPKKEEVILSTRHTKTNSSSPSKGKQEIKGFIKSTKAIKTSKSTNKSKTTKAF